MEAWERAEKVLTKFHKECYFYRPVNIISLKLYEPFSINTHPRGESLYSMVIKLGLL